MPDPADPAPLRPTGPLTRAAARLGEAGAAIGRALAGSAIGRLAALLALCLALFLPGLVALPVTDRDEGRYVQASKQMLESGEFIDIRFQDEPRWKKPAGIYWLQAGAAAVAGGPEAAGIAAYRAPSAIGAAAGVLLTAWALAPLLGPGPAALAAALTAASMVLTAEANIAKTDAVLFALTVAAMGAWVRLLTGAGPIGAAAGRPGVGRGALTAVLWTALGLAVLVKGPVAPAVLLVAAASLAALERSWRPLAALRLWSFGPLLALALAAPWYVAIALKTDGAFFAEALGRDFVGKLREGQEAHGAPPGTYLAVGWAVFWPWAALALFAAPWLWAQRARPEVRLLAVWAIPFWLILEAVPTKLPHYLLPLAPGLAGLVALWLAAGAPGASGRWRRWAAAALFAVVGLALAAATLALPWVTGGMPGWPGIVLALAGLAAVALGAAALRAGDGRGAAVSGLAAAVCLFPATLHHGLPAADYAFPSQPMARASAPFAACAGRPAASQSYREPSLVFLQGTGTRLMSVEQAAEALRDEPGAMVWIEDRRRPALLAALGEGAPPLADLAVVEAFNPNRGAATVLRLTARAGDPMLTPCGAP